MTQQYLLLQQRDNIGNVNNTLRTTNTLHSEVAPHSTSIIVNTSSTGNNVHLRGSGINRMSCKTSIPYIGYTVT